MVDEVVEGMLEAAGKQLALQVNSKETGAGVDGFVASHALSSRLVHGSGVRGLMGRFVPGRLGFFYSFVDAIEKPL